MMMSLAQKLSSLLIQGQMRHACRPASSGLERRPKQIMARVQMHKEIHCASVGPVTFADQRHDCSGTIPETFLVAPSVGTPHLAVGKLYLAGFGVENLGNGEMYLSSPNNDFRARVYLKHTTRGLMNRRGVGKLRHISGRLLWLQDFINKHHHAVLRAVPTLTNPANLATKSLSSQRVKCLCYSLGMRRE